MSPGTIAIVDGNRTTTYDDLARTTTMIASGLRAQGISRGDRVAYVGLNSTAFVETMFATARLGAVFFPVNARLAPPELEYVLSDSGSRLVVTQPGFTVPDSIRAIGHVVELGVDGAWPSEISSAAHIPIPDEPIDGNDLFMLQYTSGTSGRPKGVMLTHGNIIWNVMNLLVDVDVSSQEVALVTAPLFHTAALNQLLLPTFIKGGTAIVEAEFDAARALRLIDEFDVTILFGVPSMYRALAEQPGFADAMLDSLRIAICGGAPVPEPLLRTYLDRGLVITQGYGLTECSPGATMLRVADGPHKVGSVGTACFFSDVRVVRVVRPDDTSVDVDEPGEVIVEGPNVSPGYWRDPAATDAAFDDGWVHTGDVATVDGDGYLRIVDRLSDIYISGGENVSPAEVEEAIYAHPAVAECAVIGVPDDTWGETGRAYLRLRDGAHLSHDDLIAHLDGRVARYKIPLSSIVVDELPHNAAGKLLRGRLDGLG